MTGADENVRLVLSLLEAWGRGDGDALIGALDPAVEIHSQREVGNEGTYHGRAGYRQWEARWMEAWDEFRNEIRRAEPVGPQHLIVDVRQRGTGRGSGVVVDREVSMLFEIRDSRVVRFHLYSTHERALEVARGGDGSAAGV